MTEYIEREPLLKTAKELQGSYFAAPLIVKAIEKAPAVDVVTVTRCKDCAIASEDIMIDGWFYCHNNRLTHKPDHFCGYGERREV